MTMTKMLQHPLVILVITVIAILYSFSLIRTVQQKNAASDSVGIVADEIQILQQEVTQLQEEVEVAKQPLQQEKIIRNELLLQKPGEYVVQLEELIPIQATPTPIPSPTPQPWQAWTEVLF